MVVPFKFFHTIQEQISLKKKKSSCLFIISILNNVARWSLFQRFLLYENEGLLFLWPEVSFSYFANSHSTCIPNFIAISKSFCLNNKSLQKISKVCCFQLVVNASRIIMHELDIFFAIFILHSRESDVSQRFGR